MTNAEFAREDENFKKCCELASVEPSRRQASRWRRGTGLALAAFQIGILTASDNLAEAKHQVSQVVGQMRNTIKSRHKGVREALDQFRKLKPVLLAQRELQARHERTLKRLQGRLAARKAGNHKEM